ncbi:MAG TPA: phosphatidate cytidylyltransferase [Thermoanaerobaculia bacterium]|nr:phosphatidate cytidylyltransferase [Thermoanaerobaculia bacterium]
MQRLLTAAVTVPLALAAVFYLPSVWFFIVVAIVFGWAAGEFVRIARFWAPAAPIEAMVALVLLSAILLADLIPLYGDRLAPELELFAGALLASVGIGSLVLLAKTPLSEVFPALGAFAFGVPYFALPIASLYHIQRLDPWWLLLLMAIVWLGDTAAFYVGSRIGRNKLAPTVSPNKTWEGAVAGFATGLAATVAWSLWRLGEVDGRLLLIGAATAVAAQLGDLVESMLKRGAGVKDSGDLLPGHGGMLDRMDAMLFAAPVFLFGLWITGVAVRPVG